MNHLTYQIAGYEVKAYFATEAPESAPMVAMLHGMIEPVDVWQPVVTRLQDRYRCVLFEMPWSARQDSLWGFKATPAGWIRGALDAFGIAPDAWIAHSFGASALLQYLVQLAPQDRAQGVVPAILISPFYKASHRDVSWQVFERYVHEFLPFIDMGLRARLGNRRIDDAVRLRMAEAARDTFGCYAWMQFWQLFSQMPFFSLDHLTAPMLSLTGAKDFSTPLPDVQALTHALPAGQIRIFEESSHFLLSAREKEVVDAIKRFLQVVCPAETQETIAA